jgi:Fe-S cluster assembly protein SufD
VQRPDTLDRIDIKAVLETFRHEPAWLREQRVLWLDRYQRQGLPRKTDEEWWGTDLRSMGIHRVPALFGAEDSVALEYDAVPLLEAARKHPDLVRPWLMRSYPAESTPSLVNLNAALMKCGALLNVPDGQESEGRAVIRGGSFPRNVVTVGRAGRARFIEEYAGEDEAFCNSVTEVFVGEEAEVDVLTLIRPDGMRKTCHRAVARVAAGGTLRWYIATAGGCFARVDVEAFLDGPEAESYLIGLGVGEGSRTLDHRTVQNHVAGDSVSRIHFGTLLKGASSSIYRGMIRMEEGALRSDAYQKNDNLMLEAGPMAKAIPKLEILTDDVKCSHGSTVGRLSDEDLFYLASRGIDQSEARLLIADGFIRKQLLGAGEWTPLAGRMHAYLRKEVLGLDHGEE